MLKMKEARLEFELGKGVKSNKKNSCRYVSTKYKVKESVGLPLHRSDSLVMDNTVKVEVFHFLFALVCRKGQLPSLYAKKQQQS